MVLRAAAVAMIASEVPLRLKVVQRATNGTLALPAALRDCADSRPALAPLVVCLIGEREQHQLFAGREVEVPNGRHEADAHAGHSPRAWA